ncbi:MAG: site-2 protease family protein [Ruminococcus sp.]|nr:site-2 protease family protein [Ruminococcus sp.]
MNVDKVLEIGVHLIVLFMVIPIHEFAHAWSATKLGDDTPRYQGRLTLNPFAHIDPLGAVCMVLTGFGWGRPVQVNPYNFKKYRKGMALTAAAGPISNLIVAFFGMIAYKIANAVYVTTMLSDYYTSGTVPTSYWIAMILYYFTAINVGLAMFNLLPIPPLDGSKILSYFTGPKLDRFIAQYQMYISIAFILLVFSPILRTPLSWLQNGMMWVMDKLTFWVDLLIGLLV